MSSATQRGPTVLQPDVRELGEYIAGLNLDDHPDLTPEQVRAWSDEQLQAWLRAECQTTWQHGQWREQCAWCAGTGQHGSRRCEGCDGAGSRPALDEL